MANNINMDEENKNPEENDAQENEAQEDPKSFSLYFKINEHDPVQVTNLKLLQYLRLKHDNNYSYEYCNRYTDEGENIYRLHRSLDDVEYDYIPVPDNQIMNNDMQSSSSLTDDNGQNSEGNRSKKLIFANILNTVDNNTMESKSKFKDFEKSPLLSISTILDPRFKKVHFADRLAVYSALKRINSQLKSLKEMDASTNEVVSSTENSIWAFHDKIQLDNNLPLNENMELDCELQQYLELKRISRKSNVFEYWMKLESAFPALSKLAMRQLSILATSVPSERLFSKAGLIKDDHRNRLTGDHLNMLLFLSSLSKDDWGVPLLC